jgi:hypothetical protein
MKNEENKDLQKMNEQLEKQAKQVYYSINV